MKSVAQPMNVTNRITEICIISFTRCREVKKTRTKPILIRLTVLPPYHAHTRWTPPLPLALPCHTTRLAALARSRRCLRHSILDPNPHPTVDLTYDLDFQSQASYGHGHAPIHVQKIKFKVSQFKSIEWKRMTDGQTDATDCFILPAKA